MDRVYGRGSAIRVLCFGANDRNFDHRQYPVTGNMAFSAGDQFEPTSFLSILELPSQEAAMKRFRAAPVLNTFHFLHFPSSLAVLCSRVTITALPILLISPGLGFAQDPFWKQCNGPNAGFVSSVAVGQDETIFCWNHIMGNMQID